MDVGDELVLTLFDDVTFALKLEERERSPICGDVFLAKASDGGRFRNAVILSDEDGLTVDVRDVPNDKVYKVISSADGVKVLELQPPAGANCGSDSLEPPAEAILTRTTSMLPRAAAAGPSDCIDILVAYDKGAATWVRENGGATNFAAIAVARMNLALANTGLDELFRFRLVGITYVDAQTDSLENALESSCLGKSGWQAIGTDRDKTGADIVSVFIDTGSDSGTTGLGYSLTTTDIASFSESAYNVCAIRAVSTSNVMTHECGHTLGAGHSNVQTTQPGPQLFGYSSGYYFTANGIPYSTIMAYGHENPSGVSATEAPYFSSPDYSFVGAPVGDELHDNTRTIAQTFAYVSAFRETLVAEEIGDGGGDLGDLTWHTSKSAAIAAAKAAGKKVFLVYGRNSCGNTVATRDYTCEIDEVKSRLISGYECWFCDCDKQYTEGQGYFNKAQIGGTLPFVAVIDPAAPSKAIVQAGGYQDVTDVLRLLGWAEGEISFSPESGEIFTDTLKVAISTSRSGAKIRYTLDGSEPTASSPLYTVPITLTKTTTIKAAACVHGVCGVSFEACFLSGANLYGTVLGTPELTWNASKSPAWQVKKDAIRGYYLQYSITKARRDAWLSARIKGPATLSFHLSYDANFGLYVSCDGKKECLDVANGYSLYFWNSPYFFDVPAGTHEIKIAVYPFLSKNNDSVALYGMEIHNSLRPKISPLETNEVWSAYEQDYLYTETTGASFVNEQMVVIEPQTKTAKIYYSLDGTDPVVEDASEYDGPFFISKTTTVKAIAVEPGGESSPIVSETFSCLKKTEEPGSGLAIWSNDGGSDYGSLVRWAAQPNAISYDVFRGADDDIGCAVSIGRTWHLRYWDRNAAPNTHYRYWVRPIMANGAGEFSESVDAWHPAPLAVVAQSLPSGKQLENYTATLSAKGGKAPYAWSAAGDYILSRTASTFTAVRDACLRKSIAKSSTSFRFQLPFVFPFYGKNYTSVYVDEDGCLIFKGENLPEKWWPRPIGDLKRRAMISPLWDDNSITGMCVSANSDSAIFLWTGKDSYYGGSPENYAVILYRNGDIRIAYGEGNLKSENPIGISAGDGKRYTLVSVRDSHGQYDNGRDIVFSRAAPPIGMTLSAGGILSGASGAFGNLPFYAKVTDANGATAVRAFSFYLKPITYKVVFNKNGGTLPKGKKMAAQTMTYGLTAKLRKNVFTKKGHVFAGWATSKKLAKKGVVAYANAQSVANIRTDVKTTTLYAVWAKPTYKVAFYGTYKGVNGTMATQTFKYGKAANLTANKFKRKGYKFKGWAKSKALAKKGKVAYKNKKKVKNLVTTGKTVKLYAVWKKK